VAQQKRCFQQEKRRMFMRKKVSTWALICCLAIGLSTNALAANPSDFTDMPNDWSKPTLTFAVENNLLNGNNGKINAYGTLTQAQMAAILVRAFVATEKADLSAFSDVSPSGWYYDEMAAAVAMGIFRGSTDGKLMPNEPIPRQQAFTVLARAFLLEQGDPAELGRFSDAGEVSEAFKPALAAMAAAGYINGKEGKVEPSATITRAQFAQVISNMISRFGTPNQSVDGNVLLREKQVLPAGIVIHGDLILAEGMALNELDLSDITVEGRVVVRGGTELKLSGEASVGSLTLSNKIASFHVINEVPSEVPVTVAGGKEVTLTGNYSKAELTGDLSKVIFKDARADYVEIDASDVDLTIGNSSAVKEVAVQPGADRASVNVHRFCSDVG